MSRINETLKKTIDELDLDRRFNELAEQAEHLVVRALDTASDYAADHRDDVDRLLTRATTAIDERTDGKYADRVGKVREQLERGLEKLADRKPEDPEAPQAGDQA